MCVPVIREWEGHEPATYKQWWWLVGFGSQHSILSVWTSPLYIIAIILFVSQVNVFKRLVLVNLLSILLLTFLSSNHKSVLMMSTFWMRNILSFPSNAITCWSGFWGADEASGVPQRRAEHEAAPAPDGRWEAVPDGAWFHRGILFHCAASWRQHGKEDEDANKHRPWRALEFQPGPAGAGNPHYASPHHGSAADHHWSQGQSTVFLVWIKL